MMRGKQIKRPSPLSDLESGGTNWIEKKRSITGFLLWVNF
jgi:hypothetical protein